MIPERLMPLLTKQFKIRNGELLRWDRPVGSLVGGRLMVWIEQQRVYATEVAWALLTGTPCRWPVIALDGKECSNLQLDNLFPVTETYLRSKVTEGRCKGMLYYKHKLSEERFTTDPEARKDWQAHARAYYQPGKDRVLELQAQLLAERPFPPVPVDEPVKVKRPWVRRPKAGPGERLVKFEGEWLVVPDPVHVSDDLTLRCQAVKAGLVARFDPAQQMTLYEKPALAQVNQE